MTDTLSTAVNGSPLPSAIRRHPLARFVVQRCAAGLLTLVAASVVVFIGTTILPGSPANAILGRQASAQEVAAINRRLGYDRPLVDQYFRWLDGAVHGNLGNSAIAVAQGASRAPIWPLIRGPLRNTTILALVTVALLIPLSLFLGVWAGSKAGSLADNIVSTVSLAFLALPEFVVGSMLIAVTFTWLALLPPVSLLAPGQFPLAHPKILILPVLTLLAATVAATARLVRVGTIQVLNTDYVRAARLAGLSERKVLRRYVLRNALAPSVQIFALSIQYLFGGVIVTETVFQYPGIGQQLVNAVTSHDNTEVQAIAMILATLYITINIVADLLVILLVPRLRTQA